MDSELIVSYTREAAYATLMLLRYLALKKKQAMVNSIVLASAAFQIFEQMAQNIFQTFCH